MDIQYIAVPEAGKDYPRSWNEFLDWLGSEDACRRRPLGRLGVIGNPSADRFTAHKPRIALHAVAAFIRVSAHSTSR
jgi:hypothetical protein